MDKKFEIPFILVVLGFGIVIGIFLEKSLNNNENKGLHKLNDIINLTSENYKDSKDKSTLINYAIEGMLEKLDPYSIYLNSLQLNISDEQLSDSYLNTGLLTKSINDSTYIYFIRTNGPAHKSDLEIGYKIVKINKVNIANSKQVDKLFKDVSVNKFVIEGFDLFGNYYSKILLKEKNENKTVFGYKLDSRTGYVVLTKFSNRVSHQLESVLNQLIKENVKQVILDLRNNTGGYLEEAYEVADMFLQEGKQIVSTKGKNNIYSHNYVARFNNQFENLPLIILINKNSASASEIVAGAIQDQDRGLIVGETSYGKGLVQRQFNLFDNTAIRISISEYITPSGRKIQKNSLIKNHNENISNDSKTYYTYSGRNVTSHNGIVPDYEVKSAESNEILQEMIKHDFFGKNALIYYLNNFKLLNNYSKSLDSFKKDFTFTNTYLEKYINTLNLHEDVFKNLDSESRLFISKKLKAQLALMMYGEASYYECMLIDDAQLNKAKSLFDVSKTLANLN